MRVLTGGGLAMIAGSILVAGGFVGDTIRRVALAGAANQNLPAVKELQESTTGVLILQIGVLLMALGLLTMFVGASLVERK